ncbi:hypothetical protein RND71_009784 [Anisodus tanguticus]|uniref:Uncharacterized protein n=1 Tax=Anisodus tanguticus TaxID=243964 RepID=A0AAE1SIP5_9SOLA|nr:hypothetical protein RND71_009784 [Anisodus tanguticus]
MDPFLNRSTSRDFEDEPKSREVDLLRNGSIDYVILSCGVASYQAYSELAYLLLLVVLPLPQDEGSRLLPTGHRLFTFGLVNGNDTSLYQRQVGMQQLGHRRQDWLRWETS